MHISVFGLGYVGSVTSACLANQGHEIIAVEPQKKKCDLVNCGKAPIIEKDLDIMIGKAVRERRLKAIDEAAKAIYDTEISFVCVGTPSRTDGDLDLKYIYRVCEEIGLALKNKTQKHIVVIRSTILPGTMKNVVIPVLEQQSGKRAGIGFGVCNNPEFLRESTAVSDFFNPPKTIIGQLEQESAETIASLYKNIRAPLFIVDIELAEMAKYVDNAWHALKVSFSNEIGTMCKTLGLDGFKLMDMFCKDTKLNISPYYMKPGYAFGGSCLPKDLRALTSKARSLNINLPVLTSILQSNELHVMRGIQLVLEKGNKKVGILGLSFKADTDDLRESPMIELTERLLGKGYDIKIYDPNVSLSFLTGANRDYLINHIPHISKLLVDTLEEVLEHAGTIVIGHNCAEFQNVLAGIKAEHSVIDLVRIINPPIDDDRFQGICW